MRTLQVGDRPTRLAQAVAEFGRIEKTLHLLSMMDDESTRRRTLHQLKRGEARHKLARVVFHGKRGELRQHYREGQEDQLGALGLVVNIIVLWNTLYIDAALEQLRREGYPVEPTDVARLSPLCFEHINLLGRYAVALPESVARGALRPLRQPGDPMEGNADALSRFSVPLFPNTHVRGEASRPAARQRTGGAAGWPGTAAGGGIDLFQSQRRTLHDKAGPFNDDPFFGFSNAGPCCSFLGADASRPLLNRLPKPMVWTRSGRSRRSATRSTWILEHSSLLARGSGNSRRTGSHMKGKIRRASP